MPKSKARSSPPERRPVAELGAASYITGAIVNIDGGLGAVQPNRIQTTAMESETMDSTEVDLGPFSELIPQDNGLCVISTNRRDSTIQSSVVNVGVVQHPTTGRSVVAFVALGNACKVDNLRRDPTIAVTARAGWSWSTVEGAAELIGPDDAAILPGDDAVRLLLRQIFTAAGGSHDDWDAYDAAMKSERRVAVLVRPNRAYGNPG